MPRTIKPVTKPVSGATKPVAAKRAVTVPGAVKAVTKPAAPAPAVNAAPVPAAKPRAAAVVRNFLRKANATGGHAKTAADTLSARDTAYLRLLGITAKRTNTTSPRIADIADDYIRHGSVIFADHASKPVLDYSVLCGRLPSLGMLGTPQHIDNADTACIPVIGAGLTNAAFTRGA
jgi:hypothetical protein